VTSAKQEAGGAIQQGLGQQLTAKIFATASDAVITVDSVHRVVLINVAAERMFGIGAEQGLGEQVTRFIPEFFGDLNLEEVREFRKAGGLRVVSGLRADGRKFPVEVSISATELQGQKFYTAILRDISERLRAEEALRETGERFLLAVETAQLGTYERDLVKNEVHLNDACREILGLAEGAPPPDIAPRSAHPEDKERVLAAVARAFDPVLREVCAAEFRIRRPDGTVRWVSGRGRVVFDDTATPARPRKFLGVLLDITERKVAEAELLHAKQELTLANAQLEQRVEERTTKLHEMMAELEHMSYSMIHDMRAPLRAIESFGGILAQDPQVRLSEEAHQLVKKMQTASRRMDQLLTGALNYSDAVRKPLPVAATNAHKLLGDLLAAHPEFKPPHAEVILEGNFPWVLCNEAALAQCFAEFIRNGIKFVGPGKQPRVRVWASLVQSAEVARGPAPSSSAAGSRRALQSHPGDWVRLSFEDNGTGIPKHGRGRIFEMFQRMHGPEYPGAGIGLALVRKLIAQMGGHVGVESEKGKGSRFWLELPRTRAEESAG
jgi:PAS domain S-box-containing protein